jgi:cbb3-type cytochrome oxidase subunit 3
LIPVGLDKVSMGWEQAVKLIWMPGIVVTNRDIEKYEIISASVTIFRSGEVHRVERANSRIMKKFLLEDYPFDTQDLDVNIASSKYMTDEVVLVPDKTEFASGVEENIWGLYNLNSWKTTSIESFDGDLKKSRGILNINVKRTLDKYSQDHLIPSSIVLIISWAVFYFPFANPFITARLALSVLALLTFTNLIVKSTKELPGAAPFNWNDLLNQQIQTLMFITIIVNISSEIMMHQFEREKTARSMNHEAKVLLPGMGILNIILIISSAQSPHWLSLQQCIQVTKWLLVAFLCIYVVHVLRSAAQEKKDMENAKGDDIALDDDAADDGAEAGGDDGGDADAGV